MSGVNNQTSGCASTGEAPPQKDELRADNATVAEVADMVAFIASARSSDSPFDVVGAGITSGEDVQADREPSRRITGWLEALTDERGSFEEMRRRVGRGPAKQ